MFSVKEILLGKELLQEIGRNFNSFLQASSFPSTPSKHITTGEGKGTEEQIPETPVRTPPLSAHRREVCRALRFASWCPAMCCSKIIQAHDRVSGVGWRGTCQRALLQARRTQVEEAGCLSGVVPSRKGTCWLNLGSKSGVKFPDEGIGQDRGQHLFWKGR